MDLRSQPWIDRVCLCINIINLFCALCTCPWAKIVRQSLSSTIVLLTWQYIGIEEIIEEKQDTIETQRLYSSRKLHVQVWTWRRLMNAINRVGKGSRQMHTLVNRKPAQGYFAKRIYRETRGENEESSRTSEQAKAIDRSYDYIVRRFTWWCMVYILANMIVQYYYKTWCSCFGYILQPE